MRVPAVATRQALAAALITSSVLLTGCSGSDDKANDAEVSPTAGKTFLAPMKQDDASRKVVYEVTGSIPVDITYEALDPKDASSTADVEKKGVKLPWKATVDVPADIDELSMSVMNNDVDNETAFACHIRVDGKEVATESSDSFLASCDADKL